MENTLARYEGISACWIEKCTFISGIVAMARDRADAAPGTRSAGAPHRGSAGLDHGAARLDLPPLTRFTGWIATASLGARKVQLRTRCGTTAPIAECPDMPP